MKSEITVTEAAKSLGVDRATIYLWLAAGRLIKSKRVGSIAIKVDAKFRKNGGGMKPIMFKTEMVKAILDGNKTQTRRLKTNVSPGDTLWVKETYRRGPGDTTIYKADNPGSISKWESSLFMPFARSRIKLLVKSVWQEELLDISEEDAQAEGFPNRMAFLDYFAMITKDDFGNPTVYVIEFEVMEVAR